MGGIWGGTWRIASPASAATAAAAAGVVLLALEIAEPPLAGLARQSVNASNGSVPVWFW